MFILDSNLRAISTYLLDLLDLDVMTYMDASRHLFSFCFLVCQVAGGFELVGMVSPVFV